jgi:hypothetical protein
MQRTHGKRNDTCGANSMSATPYQSDLDEAWDLWERTEEEKYGNFHNGESPFGSMAQMFRAAEAWDVERGAHG